jgi:diguanylate cyclase (GGDEF)-like protein
MRAATTPELRPRPAARSRWAGAAMVVVLLGVSGFAVWSSLATATASERAIQGSRLTDDYARAVMAVSDEESLERKYRLEPGPVVRARYDRAASSFVTALAAVAKDGSSADRALDDTVLAQHQRYLTAIDQLFGATDRRDTAAARRIDAEQVDPAFTDIQRHVVAAARAAHQSSQDQLAQLRSLETTTSQLTPLLFVLGLGLAAVLASVVRGHRRLLDDERAQAVDASLHDALTGLPNRSMLALRFIQALSGGPDQSGAVGLLLVDLDRFKEINDTFGHHYGDQLLRQVGPRLLPCLRDGDTVARLGGDEFAILLPDVGGLDQAVAVAHRVVRELERSFAVEDVDLDVEASVGVVVSGLHGEDATTLLQRADVAMYVAKRGSLSVVTYDPDADTHSPTRLAILGDLRRALERTELVLHFQPQVDVSTGELVAAEALVRWQHPERGLVMPDDFIPLTEQTGVIGALTHEVLRLALVQARAWSDAGQPLCVSVNLSARNLLDDELPAQVAEQLATHGVPAFLLQLEVTESALMSEPDRARRVLQRLAALGVRISIDDFGAGYTSLGQLRTLPVTELKIDRSFVMTMDSDSGNALIVHSVVDLGHHLGLRIVAEGVESASALAALAGFGCDVAQGYHLSRPVPAAELDRWRAARLASPVAVVG